MKIGRPAIKIFFFVHSFPNFQCAKEGAESTIKLQMDEYFIRVQMAREIRKENVHEETRCNETYPDLWRRWRRVAALEERLLPFPLPHLLDQPPQTPPEQKPLSFKSFVESVFPLLNHKRSRQTGAPKKISVTCFFRGNNKLCFSTSSNFAI